MATARMTCMEAIAALMEDGKPRSAKVIAAQTGFSHGRVRHEIVFFDFIKERRRSYGPKIAGKETWYRLRAER